MLELGYKKTLVHDLLFLDGPSMPRNVLSHLRKDSTGRCILSLTWNSSTSEDVIHYMVNINGHNIANETSNVNESVILTSYFLCTCNSENIDVSISAVDNCGRIGQNTSHTLSKNPETSNFMVCQDDPTDVTSTVVPQNTDAGIKPLIIIICMLYYILEPPSPPSPPC